MSKNKIIVAVCLITLLTTLLPLALQAQTLLPKCALEDGNCGLCEIVQTGLNIFRWILGIVGGLALLLFVWHGFGWLMAGGNTEKVKKTADALKHTVIGILLILASWLIVNLVVVLLTFNQADPAAPGLAPTDKGIGKIFSGQPWNDPEFCD